MDAKQLFFERYEGYEEYPQRLLDGLSEDQIRRSPHPSLNPIAWTLWHLARCEDVCVNRVLADSTQVLDEVGRVARLGVSLREVGTGMPKAQVSELCEEIDLDELGSYRDAVTIQTTSTVGAISPDDLAQELPIERLRQVFIEEGAGGALGPEIVEAYSGHNKGWLLGHLVLTHHYYHIGQAFAVRSMHGAPNPW